MAHMGSNVRAYILRNKDKYNLFELSQRTAASVDDIKNFLDTQTSWVSQQTISNKGANYFSFPGVPRYAMIDTDELFTAIHKHFQLTPANLKSASRLYVINKARQIAMYIMRREMKMTFNSIGNALGGRDHTSAMHGVKAAAVRLQYESDFKNDFFQIQNIISKLKQTAPAPAPGKL